ncbi:hypothetical protein EV175_004080 [Coemansia sp. RSA 1933]|nr:hypothetical protein EV175_004080 [Coemansia sp. RSA 1933]
MEADDQGAFGARRRSPSPLHSDRPACAKRQKHTVDSLTDSDDDDDDQFEAVDNSDDDDQFEAVDSSTRYTKDNGDESDSSMPELGTVELTVGEATVSVLAAQKRKRRAAVTKRARMVRRSHHMADLMCQVMGARVLNQICRADSVVARCLSLVPRYAVSRIAEHMVPGRLELRREWASADLHYFLTVYQGLDLPTEIRRGGGSVLQEFVRCLESRVATQPWHQAMLLTGMLRALSFEARLCVGLTPVPLKITAQESAELEQRLAETAMGIGIPLDPAVPNQKQQHASLSGPQYWSEVFEQTSGKWMALDALTGAIERGLHKAPTAAYIVALDNDGFLRDVTRRYARDFVNTTLRQRLEGVDAGTDAYARVWWGQWISQWENPEDSHRDAHEDAEMEQSVQRSTMPTRLADFASNPHYVLARNLKQNEVIHPPEPVVGTVRGEPVYLRENVRLLRSQMAWMREGRAVRNGATPIKCVKKRALTARARAAVDAEIAAGRDPVSELFGEWQTDLFRPPPVIDGRVPRNDYGRIDLFKPSMLPDGAVHVRDADTKKLCMELGVDAVDAVVGFEFRCGTSTPILDGVVIPEDALDLVRDAAAEHRRNVQSDLQKAAEKRAVARWRRLLVALRVREEVDASFATRSARDDSGIVRFSRNPSDSV